jgi:hypothetical protein
MIVENIEFYERVAAEHDVQRDSLQWQRWFQRERSKKASGVFHLGWETTVWVWNHPGRAGILTASNKCAMISSVQTSSKGKAEHRPASGMSQKRAGRIESLCP